MRVKGCKQGMCGDLTSFSRAIPMRCAGPGLQGLLLGVLCLFFVRGNPVDPVGWQPLAAAGAAPVVAAALRAVAAGELQRIVQPDGRLIWMQSACDVLRQLVAADPAAAAPLLQPGQTPQDLHALFSAWQPKMLVEIDEN